MSETKVKVIETRSRPPKRNGYMMIMRGIRTREAAEAWGKKYGFATVYWIKADEKVYGVSISEKAENIETQSRELVQSVMFTEV